MSNTLNQNWLNSAIAKLSCGIQLTAIENKSVIFGLKVRTLLAKCPNILDDDTNINNFYARVECGRILSETELEVALSLVEQKLAICEADLLDNTVEESEPCKIVASGIWTRSGGHNYIPVAGILDTDIVSVILSAQAATEVITKAVANHTNSRIDLTFTGSPADTTTKANYIVVRCPSA